METLETPCLLLDTQALRRNVDRAAALAEAAGVALRPHVKTHKCAEIALMQRAAGAEGLTVSTVREARAFTELGFDDLTLATPVDPRRLPELEALSTRSRIGLLVDSSEGLAALERLQFPFRVWLEVDSGGARGGVAPGSEAARTLGLRLARSRRLVFEGLLTHGGHAYRASTPAQAAAAYEDELRAVHALAETLRAEGVEVPRLSVGSTPGLFASAGGASGPAADELRPGNYVFFDETQRALGACALEDCALTVLATVTATPEGADHVLLDAGALALSLDPGPTHLGPPRYGRVLELDGTEPGPPRYLSALWQEHAKLDLEPGGRRPRLGERLRILPSHSCLTAALHGGYHLLEDGRPVGFWRTLR